MADVREKRLVGYCTRCGGDCFEVGSKFTHRCPTKRPEAEAIVRLKRALDTSKAVIARTAWAEARPPAAVMDELKAAIAEADGKLREAYP